MPEVIKAGRSTVHSWSDEDVEHVRKLLPKIANGRKTRYKKQSAKTNKQKAQARVPVPRKKK